MRFCVKCGREISIDEYVNEYGLCIDCFIKYRGIFKTKPILELVNCSKCGRWRIDGDWIETSFNEAVRRVFLNNWVKYIDRAVYVLDVVVDNQPVKIRRNRYRVDISISVLIGRISNRVVDSSLECVLVRKTCPKCLAISGKKHSVYVQIRSENGVFDNDVKTILEKILNEPVVLNDIIEFVENRYGFDIKFYSINIARKFVNDFVKNTGAKIIESFEPIKYDSRSGRWKGVLTISLRTPSIKKGDLAEYKGEPVIVRDIEPYGIVIEYLKNGYQITVDYNSYWNGLLKKTSELYYYKKYTVIGFDKTSIYLISDDGEFREFTRNNIVRDINNGDTVYIVMYKNREYLVKKEL